MDRVDVFEISLSEGNARSDCYKGRSNDDSTDRSVLERRPQNSCGSVDCRFDDVVLQVLRLDESSVSFSQIRYSVDFNIQVWPKD